MKQYALIMLNNLRVITRHDKQDIMDAIGQCKRRQIDFIVLKKYPCADFYTTIVVEDI